MLLHGGMLIFLIQESEYYVRIIYSLFWMVILKCSCCLYSHMCWLTLNWFRQTAGSSEFNYVICFQLSGSHFTVHSRLVLLFLSMVMILLRLALVSESLNIDLNVSWKHKLLLLIVVIRVLTSTNDDCRDASNGPVTFHLTLLDCFQGIYKVCYVHFRSLLSQVL